MNHREVSIRAGLVLLPGTLAVPAHPRGVVLFAHGSGSSRASPRNQLVADELIAAGFATLLFDLLTDQEAQDRARVFDIPLLATRLAAATAWVRANPGTERLPIGYFGASTGAAAALTAAAADRSVAAVVSRGGRPDLADTVLPEVRAATLLIVGERDHDVLLLNRQALALLSSASSKSLAIVARATHLFEEPGCLQEVVKLAQSWFTRFLTASSTKKEVHHVP